MATTSTPAAQPDLSEGGYEMMRAAVNLARNHSIQTLAQLRARMHQMFPDRIAEVDQGIKFWAAHTRERYPDGLPD